MTLADEISITWQIEDIKGQDSSLTDDQARDILHELKHSHDANIGISWEVIDIYIDNFKRELNQ